MIDYAKEIDSQFEPQIETQIKTRKFKNVSVAVKEINKAYEARDEQALRKIIFDFAACLASRGIEQNGKM